MKWNLVFLSMLLALFSSACGAAAPEIASTVPDDSPPAEVAFVTVEPPPATATSTPLPPTSEPSPTTTELDDTPTPQPEPTVTDTPTPEPSPTPEPDWLNNYGRTADNLVYLGNPDAPVSVIDFSDFM